MNKKQTIKSITEGSIFVAFYCLMTLLTRYLITGVDSLIYYIWPLPIAIYSGRNKLTFSIATTLAACLLSFLFTTPIYVLMLIIPNLLIGFTLGVLEAKTKVKVINYISVFLICLVANFLSIYAYEIITGIGYFDDVIEIVGNVTKVFTNVDSELVKRVVEISSVVVLVVDSLIKEILLFLLFIVIVKRLKLIPNYHVDFKIPIKYHYSLTVIYIMTIAIFVLLLRFINIDHIIIELLNIIILSILFIYSIYLLYQFVFFLRIKLKNISNIWFILIIILSFIMFPFSILIALVLNVINWNFILASLK